eukprot:g20498.t1
MRRGRSKSTSGPPGRPSGRPASASFSTNSDGERLLNEIDQPMLLVSVPRAKGLTNKDTFSLSDPYVKVVIIGKDGKLLDEKKSEVVQDSLNPEWRNCHFVFPFSSEARNNFQGIRLEVWDRDVLVHDDFMGQITLPAEAIYRKINQEWRVLERRTPKDKISGALLCSAVFRNQETGFGVIPEDTPTFDVALNLGLRAAIIQLDTSPKSGFVSREADELLSQEDSEAHKSPRNDLPIAAQGSASASSFFLTKQKPGEKSADSTPDSAVRSAGSAGHTSHNSVIVVVSYSHSYSHSYSLVAGSGHTSHDSVGGFLKTSKKDAEAEEIGIRSEVIADMARSSIAQVWDFERTGSFRFTDHARDEFALLRECFGYAKGELVSSLCSKPLVPLGKQAGKSGAGFYRTFDKRLFLKTLRNDEVLTLLSMLPDYLKHVKENPETRLPRFYALVSIQLENQKAQSFVVMNNLFESPRPIHAIYDLKGSQQGRRVSEEERQQYLRKRRTKAIMKDLDFEANNERVPLFSEDREGLIELLKTDTEFLTRFGLMDYSLLVGISFRDQAEQAAKKSSVLDELSDDEKELLGIKEEGEEEEEIEGKRASAPAETKASSVDKPVPSLFRVGYSDSTLHLPRKKEQHVENVRFSSITMEQLDNIVDKVWASRGRSVRAAGPNLERGALEAVNGDIFFIGIIDILQRYNQKKKMETVVKGMIHDKDQISSVKPAKYARRFMDFMTEVVLDDGENPSPRKKDKSSKSRSKTLTGSINVKDSYVNLKSESSPSLFSQTTSHSVPSTPRLDNHQLTSDTPWDSPRSHAPSNDNSTVSSVAQSATVATRSASSPSLSQLLSQAALQDSPSSRARHESATDFEPTPIVPF